MNEVSHDRDPAFGDELAAKVRKKPALVAVDLGAESCRVSLLRWIDGQPEIRLVHRFANSPADEGNGLRWDIAAIVAGRGRRPARLRATRARRNRSHRSGRLGRGLCSPGRGGQPVANPFCYRDERTVESQNQVHSRISPDRLYQLTGVQILTLNTLYQLRADGDARTESSVDQFAGVSAAPLGGKRVSEYTNATHTQLLGVEDQAWCPEIFAAAGLDVNAAPPLVESGNRHWATPGPSGFPAGISQHPVDRSRLS